VCLLCASGNRIYRETPAVEEGGVEVWELLLDDIPRFKSFMTTAKKSKVPCEKESAPHHHSTLL
jgi:hypothetical protein